MEKKKGFSIPFWRPIKKQVLVQFYSQLSTLVTAGFGLLRAIRVCMEQTPDKSFKELLSLIYADLEGGSPISQCLEKFPRIFTPFHLGMVRTAEKSGTLPDIMKKLAIHEEKEMKLRHRLQAALTYPIFVTSFAFIVVILLTRYLCPLLNNVTLALGRDRIPAITKFLIMIGNSFSDWRIMAGIALFLALMAFIMRKVMTIRMVKYHYGRLRLRIPSFGKLYKKVILIRMCRVLSTLLSAGVPSVMSIRVADEVGENVYFSDAIMQKIIWRVDEGKLYSQAFGESTFFPQVLINMLVVGEQTGKLPFIIDKLADFFEIDVDVFLANISSFLEPILIVVLGGITFFILLAAFLPMYSIMNSF
jgi:type IV pilus assembly protein PilC